MTFPYLHPHAHLTLTLTLTLTPNQVTDDFRMVLKAERAAVPPLVKLDGAYKFVDAL